MEGDRVCNYCFQKQFKMPSCISLAHKLAKGPLKLERSAKFFEVQVWESLGNSLLRTLSGRRQSKLIGYVHKALELGF